MQMKNLLRLMGALALTTGAVTSVVACNQQTVVNLDTVLKNKALGTIYVTDITKPTEKELKDAIKKAAGNENINLDGITVTVIAPKVKSDPISSATVTPDGKIYNGDAITVNFTLATKVDIKDIKIDKLEKAVDTTKPFTDLNKDQVIITAVVDAIKKAKQIDVVANTDFTLNNNKEKAGNQVAGDVEFTVTAKGDKITGEFKFTVELTVAKVDIKDIKIDKLEKAVDTIKPFTDLNKDQVIITAVVDAIKKAKQIDVVANTDFTLNNNKEKAGNQVAGDVEFTVTAKGDKITGEFKFTVELTVAKVDIKDIKIDKLEKAVDTIKPFTDLNKDQVIITAVVDAIKKAKQIDVVANTDFTLNNNKEKAGNQVAGDVEFTVTAKGDKITGEFKFTVELTVAKVDIKDIKIDKLEKTVDTIKPFTDLNKDQVIITAVVDAIKKAKQIDVVANTDFTLNNNKEKAGNQVAGDVEFTVTAKGDKITGEFKFTVELTVAKVDIKDIKIDKLEKTVDTIKPFTDLNKDQVIITAVVDAIKKAKQIDVVANTDFTLNNNKEKAGNQVAGDVEFTVTAKGDKITGEFKFTVNLK